MDAAYEAGHIAMSIALWLQNKIGANAFVRVSDSLFCVVIAWRRMMSVCTQSRRGKYLMYKWWIH